MLRMIGKAALLYLAYWAGANGVGAADAVLYVKNLLAGVDFGSE